MWRSRFRRLCRAAGDNRLLASVTALYDASVRWQSGGMVQDTPWAPPAAPAEGPATLAKTGLQPLKLQFRIDDQETQRETRALYMKPRFLITLIAVLGIVVVPSLLRGGLSWVSLIGPAVVLFFLFFLFVVSPRSVTKKLREAQRSVTIELTDDHFIVADLESKLMLSWKNFTHYQETAEMFRVFEEGGLMRYVPKRAIGKTDVDLARAWFSHRLSNTPPPAKKNAGTKTILLWVILVVLFWAAYNLLKT